MIFTQTEELTVLEDIKRTLDIDLSQIRDRARAAMQRGAVTDAYGTDPARVVSVLNEVLATEIVCVLRYKSHYLMASGIRSEAVTDELKQHADDEMRHADRVAERIVQLGGIPDMNPATLVPRSHADYNVPSSLRDMMREDLIAERVAIATYSEIIRWLGDADPTTRRMMEDILAQEEEHADELAHWLRRSG